MSEVSRNAAAHCRSEERSAAATARPVRPHRETARRKKVEFPKAQFAFLYRPQRPTICGRNRRLYGGERPCPVRIGRGETRTTIGARTSTDGPRPAGGSPLRRRGIPLLPHSGRARYISTSVDRLADAGTHVAATSTGVVALPDTANGRCVRKHSEGSPSAGEPSLHLRLTPLRPRGA